MKRVAVRMGTTLGQLQAETAGLVHGHLAGDADVAVSAMTHDSRRAAPGRGPSPVAPTVSGDPPAPGQGDQRPAQPGVGVETEDEIALPPAPLGPDHLHQIPLR